MSARTTKAWPEARDAWELAGLRLFRRLTRQEQRAAIDAAFRLRDGQPIEQCLIEEAIALGYTPEEAREHARATLSGEKYDWRKALD